jgi:hypothetical protein
MDLRHTLRRVLLANELGNHATAAYRFSDPDGPAGRSGYSFGICQFDLRHNPRAAAILREAGFLEREIRLLKDQTCTAAELAQFNARLQARLDVVDRADEEEFDAILRHTLQVTASADLHLAGEDVLIHLADYHNQFHLSFDGKAVRHFKPFSRPITAVDIYDYKLATAWGQKRPDDVTRRYNNALRICREAA